MPCASSPRRFATSIHAIAILALVCLLGGQVHAQMLDRLWVRFAPKCSSYSVAPDGGAVVSSDWDGLVQCQGEDGRILWRARFPSRAVCAVSARAGLTVVFQPGVEAPRSLVFIDRTGRVLHRETVPGALRAAAVSEDGRTTVVLSGSNRVTIFKSTRRDRADIVRTDWRWKRRTFPGRIVRVGMDADGSHIVLAGSDPDVVQVLTDSLRPLWRWTGPQKDVARVLISRQGDTVAAITESAHGEVPTVIVWRAGELKPLWTRTLRGDLPKVAFTGDARYMVAGYRTRLWHGARSVVEQRVMLFNVPEGRSLWEEGGLMFGAHLIGVAGPPLLVLTHDGRRVLAALDNEGHMRARYRLQTPIQSAVLCADGTHFVVMTDARLMYLFRTRR